MGTQSKFFAAKNAEPKLYEDNRSMAILIVLAGIGGVAWLLAALLERSVEKFYRSDWRDAEPAPSGLVTGKTACPYCKNPTMADEPLVFCERCKSIHHFE